MKDRNLTCIVCPRGCNLTVKFNTGGGISEILGNACKRGEKHAIGECTNPVRTVTSIVRVSNREDTMVPVKTLAPIPKGEMFTIMEKIRAARVEAPVKIGDVILDDIFGTQVVATGDVL